MLSIDYIRQNKEKVAEAAKNKRRMVDLDKLLKLDDERRELITQIQTLREERNQLSKNADVEQIRARGKELKEKLKDLEEDLREVEEDYNELMLYVPNVPLDEVPVGTTEEDNVELYTWGEPTQFTFKPQDHIALAESLDLLDLERGSKISGFRGYFLKNELAQMQMGIMFYVFQKLAAKGYTPIIAPSVVKEFTIYGSGHFPWGREEDVYALKQDNDMYLSGTAEIPVTAYHSGDILEEKDLPKKFVAMSPCYRREHGSYGRDTKGILRVHEFWKIEQVILGASDLETSRELHKELQANTEEILQDFELPYHVLLMNTSDMGEPQVLKYDTEVWIPSENTYREIASNSIMGDFQARRLNIKYRTASGELVYCHTLNDTAIPSTRVLIAILENHQQEDGSIRIPEKLQNTLGFSSISKRI